MRDMRADMKRGTNGPLERNYAGYFSKGTPMLSSRNNKGQTSAYALHAARIKERSHFTSYASYPPSGDGYARALSAL